VRRQNRIRVSPRSKREDMCIQGKPNVYHHCIVSSAGHGLRRYCILLVIEGGTLVSQSTGWGIQFGDGGRVWLRHRAFMEASTVHTRVHPALLEDERGTTKPLRDRCKMFPFVCTHAKASSCTSVNKESRGMLGTRVRAPMSSPENLKVPSVHRENWSLRCCKRKHFRYL
jgi:hypothetical protein